MGLTRERGRSEHTFPGTQKLLQELISVVKGRLCRPEQRQICRAEHGAFTEWACGACAEYVRPEAISPWTWHLMFLHRLKKAGYPLRANDLSLETWLLLGLIEEALAQPQGGRDVHHKL
jgi:hypothetical protein|uniref:Uncharacterized protein n=1 Tax=Desulfobacca acetoxidans TaxID=60893 RepID=A0A7V6DND6_9BACT